MSKLPSARRFYWWGARKPAGWYARYVLGRVCAVRALADARARRAADAELSQPSFWPAAVLDRAARDLRAEGIALGLTLPPGPLTALRSGAERATHGRTGSVVGVDTGRWTAVLALARALLPLAARVLGGAPVFAGSRAWWSRPGPLAVDERRAAGQEFHYDLYDTRALAVFFYLTDVDAENGPHVCVRGSHRLRPLREQMSPFRRSTDARIARVYGAGSLLTVTGPAGTGFAEDVFCFHRALAPATGERCILELLWTRNDYRPAEFSR